eukprot:12863793-Ditylum_brightwellii.AAC.1
MSTWLCAIKNNNFLSWPGITYDQVSKYLTNTMATSKGHMACEHKNTQSATKQQQNEDASSNKDFFPKQEPVKIHEIYLALKLTDSHDNVIYTDITSKFPTTSQSGNKHILVAYDYNSNGIVATTVCHCSDAQLVAAVQKTYKYLTDHGFKPQINVLNNEASAEVKRAITATGATYQFVELHNHC